MLEQLTHHVDVFVSMCVLHILHRMDDERLSLLGEDMAGDNDEECLNMGMAFLQTACKSSSLAVRYIYILQHIGGNEDQGGTADAPQRKTNRGLQGSQVLGNMQSGLSPWNIEPHDLLMGAGFDFGNFDDWLWETDPLSDLAKSNMSSMNW